ncbi:hypothetical protein JCM8097_004187 [Rhodosporidiobolus ruineniae]
MLHIKRPKADGSDNWRFRHHAVFLGLGILTAAADLILAIFMFFYQFGTPAYVWGVAMAVSIIEALYIGGMLAFIEFHIGTHSHWGHGKTVLALWSGSVTINLAYFIGGYSEASSDSDATAFKIGLFIGILSQLSGLVLTILAVMLHIVLLTDPHPELHGYHPKKRWKNRKHFRRHHHAPAEDDEDGDGDEGGWKDDDEDAETLQGSESEDEDEDDGRKRRKR